MNRKDRQQRKKKKRQERIRQQKHQQRALGFPHVDHAGGIDQPSDVADGDLDDFDDFDDEDLAPLSHADLAPVGASQYSMERTLRKMAHAMKAQSFNSMDDMNTFLQTKFTGKIDDDLSKLSDPKEHAQELAFQAMESNNQFDAKRLAWEALKLDPDCVDALSRVAFIESQGNSKVMAEGLRKALDAGRRALGGEAFFLKNTGSFWGTVHTRPYMRALCDLAHLHYFDNQFDSACEYFEEMLRLNPNDNQGVRYPLVGSAFLAGKIEIARKVLKDFVGEDSATMHWARSLERFVSRDELAAANALKKARSQNQHVAPMILGIKDPPPAMGGYSPGRPSEAREILINIGMAWVRQPGAMEWLGRQCGVDVVPQKRRW